MAKMKDWQKVVLGVVVLSMLGVVTIGGVTDIGKSIGIYKFWEKGGAQVPASITGNLAATPKETSAPSDNCPSTGLTTVTIIATNKANTSATDYTALSLRAFDAKTGASITSNPVVTVAATSAGSGAVSFPCGMDILLKPVGSDAANGRNSMIISSDAGTVTDGNLQIHTSGAAIGANVKVYEHATLEFQVYDKLKARVLVSGVEASAQTTGVWNLTGGSYYTTTSNSTAEVVNTDGDVTRYIAVRAVQSDTEFTDRRGLLLVDADTSDWAEPTVKYNGVTLSRLTSSSADALNGDEAIAYSAFEYAYVIPETITHSEDEIYFNVKAASGINPDVNVVLAVAARGQYLALDGIAAKVSSAKDDSTHSSVYTRQTVTQVIS